MFHRGHVYWVEIPDEPGHKRRPALVLSPDFRNALASDLIVVASPNRTHVPLATDALNAGLPVVVDKEARRRLAA